MEEDMERMPEPEHQKIYCETVSPRSCKEKKEKKKKGKKDQTMAASMNTSTWTRTDFSGSHS